MIVDSLNQANTIIEFDDEFIAEDKTEIRKLEFEIFVSSILEHISNQ